MEQMLTQPDKNTKTNKEKSNETTKKKCQNKIKIECLKCSSSKNTNKRNKKNTESISSANLDENLLGGYDFELSANEISENLIVEENYQNNRNIRKTNYHINNNNKLIFTNQERYYMYNKADIKEILEFPNANDSFANYDKNLNKDSEENNSNKELTKLANFDDILNKNINYKI